MRKRGTSAKRLSVFPPQGPSPGRAVALYWLADVLAPPPALVLVVPAVWGGCYELCQELLQLP